MSRVRYTKLKARVSNDKGALGIASGCHNLAQMGWIMQAIVTNKSVKHLDAIDAYVHLQRCIVCTGLLQKKIVRVNDHLGRWRLARIQRC